MQQRKLHRARSKISASKPGVISLLAHIIRGTFANGMLIPALVSIGAIFVLYRESFPHHATISGLIIAGLVLIGLVRGCASWQEELVEYRRRLTRLYNEQQRGEANRGQAIPGFIPYTHRR